jgi:hypothetical protein
VWKTILPLGTKDRKIGKWSPSWEGPFRVVGVVPGNAYFLETLEGQSLRNAMNGRYLKKYYPSIWQGTQESRGIKADKSEVLCHRST